jgi:DNA-binding SARP family transcriptional activator
VVVPHPSFGILGPLVVHADGGAPVALRGRRRRTLLAVLLVNANEVVPDGVLFEELWPAEPPASGATALRVRVSQLRTVLADAGATLVRQADGYVLQVDPARIDARRFERLLAQGSEALRAGTPERAVRALREALRLWRGPALGEFADQPSVRLEAARLTELHVTAQEELAEAELALGHHAALVPELERLVAAEPLRERPRGLLMLALYRSGRQADALAAYREARRALVDELGLEPSRRLRELEAAILRQQPGLDAAPPAPAVATPATAALPADAALPAALAAHAGTGFVGRDAELARLLALWARGSPRLLGVAGEAGIGKTRLVAELARAVHDAGGRVLAGRAPDGPAPPYAPWAEALGPWARTVDPAARRAALGAHAAELARLLPEPDDSAAAAPAEPHPDAEARRHALFAALAAALAAAAGDERLLLVLDDLHWASPPTLLALRHVLAAPGTARVTVVAAYRAEAAHRDGPLGALLAAAARSPGSEELRLTGLDDPAVAALARAVTTGLDDEPARRLARELARATGGNPFYVRAVVSHLLETGRPADPGQAGTWLPAGLRRVIAHRVEGLSPAARRVVAAGSVAGPEFGFAVVERALGDVLPGGDALDALDEAVAAGLLTETPAGGYAFVHALVHRTVYDDLGAARRQRLHRRIGEAVEAQAGAPGQVEALAHHFAEAAADGQAGKAAAYALAAGTTAMAGLGYEEAAGQFQRGLDALALAPGTDGELRAELLLGLGEARWSTGEMEAARSAFLAAADAAEALCDPDRLARAALGFCGPPRFEPDQAYAEPVTRLLERALAATDPGAGGATYARLTARLAAALTYTGPATRRTELARTALVAARNGRSTAALGEVLSNAYFAMRGPDDLHARLHTLNELERLAGDTGDGRLASLVHYWRSVDLLELGRGEGSRHELAVLERLAETLGQRYPWWLAAGSRARDAQFAGALDRGEALAQRALELGDEVGEAAFQVFGAQLVWTRREQGRVGELVEGVEAVVARFPELVAWRCGLALFYAETGRDDEARATLAALAAHAFGDVPRDVLWPLALTIATDVVARLDVPGHAAPLHALLAPFADRCVVAESAVCLGSIARPLGVLAGALGRFDAAERHFERALARNEELGSVLWSARTRHDWATVIRRRDAPGDGERADALDRHALADADRLGLAALAADITAGAPVT